MKVLRCLIVLTVILFVLSCAKDNQKIPLKKITLTKLYTIEGYADSGKDSLRSFSVFKSIIHYGSDNHLYVYDFKLGSVKIFDDKGEFKVSLGKKGMGPEEIESFNTFYTFRDTVFIVDNRTKLKKFSKEGSLFEIKPVSSDIMSLPQHCHQVNDSTIIGQVTEFIQETDKFILRIKLVIMDKGFKIRKIVSSKDIDYVTANRHMDIYPIFTLSNDRIYLTNKSKTEYKIQVFSFRGEYIKTIKKKYIRTRFSKEEIELLKKDKSENPYFDKFYDYKVSILRLSSDKYGNLWVQKGDIGTKITFDIFNEDKQIDEFSYDLKKEDGDYAQKIIFVKNKMYIHDYDNNLIEVYDYKIE